MELQPHGTGATTQRGILPRLEGLCESPCHIMSPVRHRTEATCLRRADMRVGWP